MTSYRFPASLGGGEHECVARVGSACGFDLADVRDRQWLHISDLTVVVPPPTPPEPGPGCHLLRRLGHPDESILGHGGEWTADGGWQRWEEFWEVYGGPGVTIEGPLVPAPPEVTLPWIEGAETVTVNKSPTIRSVFDSPSWLSADLAERKAHALLSAARTVREAHKAPTGERAV